MIFIETCFVFLFFFITIILFAISYSGYLKKTGPTGPTGDIGPNVAPPGQQGQPGKRGKTGFPGFGYFNGYDNKYIYTFNNTPTIKDKTIKIEGNVVNQLIVNIGPALTIYPIEIDSYPEFLPGQQFSLNYYSFFKGGNYVGNEFSINFNEYQNTQYRIVGIGNGIDVDANVFYIVTFYMTNVEYSDGIYYYYFIVKNYS